MRVTMWHGWLLAGTGSNVVTARQVEALRAAGHDVALLCQEPHPERFAFIDGWGSVNGQGVSEIRPTDATPARGRAIMLRPEIGELLPVFVVDEYEGFRVKRFVDLSDAELQEYLEKNVAALRRAVAWHRSELVIAGHIVPGPVVALRALGPGRYSIKVHGSDLEYAIEVQRRYADLARPALEGAVAIIGPSDDVLARAAAVAPAAADRGRRVLPGVETDRFRPMSRAEGLLEGAQLLSVDPRTARGRPRSIRNDTLAALHARDATALDRLALRYDQTAPDADATAVLRGLAMESGALVGYLGKLIPQKGVERMIAAVAVNPPARGLVIGFGGSREWYEALVRALGTGDAAAAAWLADAGGMDAECVGAAAAAAGVAGRIDFTGLLDHRYAPFALAALDVLIVPSTAREAFGLVAAEGAAAGALPLVARHSGLAEVADALEDAVACPGIFSFRPGPGSVERCAAGLRRLLGLDPRERREFREAVSAFVAREWTWDRSADHLLRACIPPQG